MIAGLALLVLSAWTSPASLALFLISAAVAGMGVGAIVRGSLTVVISITHPDDRASALATFFTVGYAGVSLPVIGLGVALQHISPRAALLIFGVAIAVGVLAATPVLVRRSLEAPKASEADTRALTGLCRCHRAAVPS